MTRFYSARVRIPNLVGASAALSAAILFGGLCSAQETPAAPKKEPAAPAAKAAPAPAAAAQSSPEDAQLAAIRAQADHFVEVFDKHDAKAVAECWTENGEYVDETGEVYAGRDAIQKGYERFFKENPQARIQIKIDSLRMLSDVAAIEDGRTIVDPPFAGAPAFGKYTAVHLKVNGNWLMATVRDSRVEMPSNYGGLNDLEWLIGTWRGEAHGAKSESNCSWVAGKSFVQRQFTATNPDGTTLSGIQIIGWNAQDGRIQSWTFSSDGGNAVGAWSPIENGWAAEMHGMTNDGTPTSSINLFTRLDDNAYAWQSVQRTKGGVALPDTEEVVLKRQQATR